MKLGSDRIIQPLLTEKTAKSEATYNEFAVIVDPKMTKLEIKDAVEQNFGVRPLKVRTVNFRKKSKRTRYGIVAASTYKKALLRLPEGKRLEMK